MPTTIDLTGEITRMRQAASDYHALLPDASAHLRQTFEADMLAEKLDYGPRMLNTSLRPHFITSAVHDYVTHVASTITRAMHKIGRAALQSAELQDALGLIEAERELIRIDPGYTDISTMSRLDAFLSEAGLHMVEYNAECPTGVGYNERLFRVFDRLEPMRRFTQQQPLHSTDGTSDVLDSLLDAYRRWGGREEPRIAILDWREVVTRGEFEIFAEYFEKRGVFTRLVDPRDVRITNGRVTADGEWFNLIYRRLITSEFIERRDECPAVDRAYRERLACFVNNFRTKVLHKKLIFSIFWEPRFESLLDAAELKVAREHVPWTARLTRLSMEHALQNRADTVLKPNDDYGGKGLMLGADASDAEWAGALSQAVDDGTAWVLQQRIPLFQERFPDLDGNLDTYYVDLDPFFFGERMYGYLTRMSRRAISNVTTGGGQIPTYVMADR